MKKLTFLTLVLVMLASLVLTVPVFAQDGTTDGAAPKPWTSNIWYFNPTAVAGTFTISYYIGGTTTDSPELALDAYKSGKVFIGDIAGIPATGTGSAVISSDRPIQAVYEQIGAPDKNSHSLYTAFSANAAGQKIFIPSFIHKPTTKNPYISQIGVQNVTNGDVDVTTKIYAHDGTLVKELDPVTVAAGAATLVDPTLIAETPITFDGAVVVESTGDVVAAAQETKNGVGPQIYSFEGLSAGSNTFKFPFAGCKAGGRTTLFFIQNTTSATATVTTAYNKSTTGAVLGKKSTAPANYALAENQSVVIDACKELSTGKSGTVTITSDNPVAAVLKISGTYTTAITGQVPDSGKTEYWAVVPYVTWAKSASGWRTTLYVENVGAAAATYVNAEYYRVKPVYVGDPTVDPVKVKALGAIPVNAVRATSPSTAKALYPNKKPWPSAVRNTFAGGVIVKSDQPFVVRVLAVKSSGTKFSEEYMGIPFVNE